ncbi:hypothetical protein [Dyadobacter sp. CY312]|uniref:hypothetical protein n=1 Tax=Dyadobacter sp. CY312 TaxID=2907303 RepID=UPI001F202576|nr:hypothetical protein [Dyadobacter sp. CY312]MCE7041142.1 hypothetical protein [Dyadobacter sp. CY312]
MTTDQPIVLLQQRDFGQKINASFDFAIKNLGPLAKSIMFIAGPPALLSGIAQGMYQSRLLTAGIQKNSMESLYQYLTLEYFLVVLLSSVTYFLCYAAVSSFMVLYEEKGLGSKITPGDVWQKIVENLSVSITSSILALFAILIGLVFFIIPGIYLAVCFQLYLMVVIREKSSATDSLSRSRKLVDGKWWSTFGLVMIMSIIAGIISIVFQFPVLLATILTTLGLGNGIAGSPVVLIIASIISIVGANFVNGLVWIAVGFQYYNLVERRDGSGLRSEIESLGSGEVQRPGEEF